MSKLGCIGSGNKFQKQKKGPWSLGDRKAKVSGQGWGGVGVGGEAARKDRGMLWKEGKCN